MHYANTFDLSLFIQRLNLDHNGKQNGDQMGGNKKQGEENLVLSMIVNGLKKLFGPTKHFLTILTCI